MWFVPSIWEARKFAAKFVTFPLWTLRFHSPDKITLKALVILNPAAESETVITKELIVPIVENVSCLAFGIDDADADDVFVSANALL